MSTDTAHEKQQVHELVERLAPSQVRAVRGLLEAMLDPLARAAASARPDDEPVIEEDRRRARLADERFSESGGHGVSMEDVLAGFGLKSDDFPFKR